MIRYEKSAAVPSSLRRGVTANAANCAAYDAGSAPYRAGYAKFDITGGIYGTKVVKRHLKADQHDKCGFCEAIFDANVSGDVEHYRPKGAVMVGNIRTYPGYYWLGYTWANLSYACPDCNEYRKRDLFPLANEQDRAISHNEDIDVEDPLLLDPYGARDPREHILFLGEAPTGRTLFGDTTIELLALNRTALARDRLDHLRNLSRLHESVRLLDGDPRPEAMAHVARLRTQLVAAVGSAAKFSAASADHIAELDAERSHLPED